MFATRKEEKSWQGHSKSIETLSSKVLSASQKTIKKTDWLRRKHKIIVLEEKLNE